MTYPWRILTALLSMTLGVGGFASDQKWATFESSNHFSVLYPKNWHRIGISKDRLALLSSKTGAEGIVIKQGQAEIVIMEAEGSLTMPLSEVVEHYTQGAILLSSKDVTPIETTQGCSLLKEFIVKDKAVPVDDSPIPVPYIINTDFFCELKERKFVTLLRNWEGDQRQEAYQQIALQMTKTIRILIRD